LNIIKENQILSSQFPLLKVSWELVRIAGKKLREDSGEDRTRGGEGVAVQHTGMLKGHSDALERIIRVNIIRSRVRPISARLASTGSTLHVYSQEQRRRGEDAHQTEVCLNHFDTSFKKYCLQRSML